MLAALPTADQGVRAIDVTPGQLSSSPVNVVAYEGKLYFFRTTNTDGGSDELWSYDPATEAATRLGALPALSIQESSPLNKKVAALDNKIYFSAAATSGGNGAVWAFDLDTGQAAPVVDRGIGANHFLAYNGLLYFAGLGEAGVRYHRHSPVTGNTTPIGDRVDGRSPLTPFFGKLYFGNSGLYYYDPVTFEVELAIDGFSHDPGYLTPLGNYLLFNGRKRAWYAYNVASEEAELVKGSELPSGEGNLRRYAVTLFGHLYTWNTESGQPDELWKMSPVGSAVPAWTLPGDAVTTTLTPFEDRLYFAMEGDERGLELWRTAGEDGVELVADINPRSEFPNGSRPRNLTVLDGKLYFTAYDGNATYGSEVWIYDPSLSATAAQQVTTNGKYTFGATGLTVNFSGFDNKVATNGKIAPNGADALVTAHRFAEAPAYTGGVNAGTVGEVRWTLQSSGELNFDPNTALEIALDSLSELGDFDPRAAVVYHRAEIGTSTFASLATSYDEATRTITATGFTSLGEYALALDSDPLPVELSSFGVVIGDENTALLNWTTASETNNAGFRVQRKVGEANGETWTTIGSVGGAGTTTEAKSYRYVDGNLPYEANRLTYRLKQVDMDGSTDYSNEVTVERSVQAIELLGTYPNPVQQQATLHYAVPERQNVTIHLYDMLGRRLQTVVDGEKQGRHTVQLDVSGLATGVYFLRLTAATATKTQRLNVVQ